MFRTLFSMKKKKIKTFKVYCTYSPEGKYYIGFSSKDGKQYDRYFGSSKEILIKIKENPDSHGYRKITIGEYTKKSHAKAVEAILQWDNRHDPRQLNDMWNVRLRLSHLKELNIPDWKP